MIPAPQARLAALLAALALSLSAWLVHHQASTPSQPTAFGPGNARDDVTTRHGRWGTLRFSPVWIRMDMAAMAAQPLPRPGSDATEWIFPGMTRTDVARHFLGCGLSRRAADGLLAHTAMNATSVVTRVMPPQGVVLSLSDEIRRCLHTLLAQLNPGSIYSHPTRYVADAIGQVLDAARLGGRLRDIMERLLYEDDGLVLFADPAAALAACRSEAEVLALAMVFTTQRTLEASVAADPGEEEEFVAYWSVSRPPDEIRTLLRNKNADGVLLRDLLTPFARARLASYEMAAKEEARDCHWTTLNFFNPQPDDRYANPVFAAEAFGRDYGQIAEPVRMGDVVLFETPDHRVIHSCVYLAGDLVFTRNGSDRKTTWTISTLHDVETYYGPEGPFHKVYMRRKA